MLYARIYNGVVAEITNLPDGITPADAFHPGIATAFIECTEVVQEGWAYDGASFAAPEFEPVDLSVIKAGLRAAVDGAAEQERLKYITPGTGQAMTYQQKADEALRFFAEQNSVAGNYPLLSAEVGITASDLAGVAQVVKTAYERWQAIGALIEAARLGAKKAIDAAETNAAAQAVADAVAWPTLN